MNDYCVWIYHGGAMSRDLEDLVLSLKADGYRVDVRETPTKADATRVSAHLRQAHPDVVIGEASAGANARSLIRALVDAKRARPATKTAYISQQGEAWNHLLFDCPEIDFVIVGDVLLTGWRLVETLSRGGDLAAVSGLAWRPSGEPALNGIEPAALVA